MSVEVLINRDSHVLVWTDDLTHCDDSTALLAHHPGSQKLTLSALLDGIWFGRELKRDNTMSGVRDTTFETIDSRQNEVVAWALERVPLDSVGMLYSQGSRPAIGWQ